MSNSQKPNVCVVTKPSTEDSYAEPIYNFCTILQPSADDLYLISGDTVLQDSRADRIKGIGLSDGSYTGQRYLDFVLIQFHICYQLLRLRKRIDLVYFHKGVMALALPVLFARLLHVKSCVIKLSDFYSNRDLTRYSSTYISIVSLLQWLSFWSADAAVVFSEQEVDSVPTECVFVSFSNYIDFDTFTIETPISERKFDIGFVGRFTEIKGVELFVEAAKEIIKDNPDTHVVLIGDGPLLDTIKQSVTDIEQIQLYGWIDYEQLPNKYNQIQFLFAPSKSEGLPTVLLEAMGCGTIPISTAVGSIDEIVDHGVNGYLMNNSSKNEMHKIYDKIKSLENTKKLSETTRESVIENYSKDAAQQRFKIIMEELN